MSVFLEGPMDFLLPQLSHRILYDSVDCNLQGSVVLSGQVAVLLVAISYSQKIKSLLLLLPVLFLFSLFLFWLCLGSNRVVKYVTLEPDCLSLNPTYFSLDVFPWVSYLTCLSFHICKMEMLVLVSVLLWGLNCLEEC